MTATACSVAELSEWAPPLGVEEAMRADALRCHVDAYRACGPVYRLQLNGSPAVTLAGVAANEFIWANSGLWDYGGGKAYFREQFSDRYLSAMDGAAHHVKRSQMMAGFRTRNLLHGAAAMHNILSSELRGLNGSVDLRRLCKRLVVCMASRALVQVDLPAGFEDQIAQFEHELLAGTRLGEGRHDWYSRPEYQALKHHVFGVIDEVFDRRAAAPPEHDDALSLIAKQRPPGQPPAARTELVHDLAMLLLAGSETTAHTILWSLLYLYTRPDWLARLRRELEGFDPSRITDEQLYPQLQAVVREVERLRPPFPATTQLAGQQFVFDGITVPAGTTIFHPMTLPHFLDEIFADPWQFQPERFLHGHTYPAKAVGIFGGGAHLCLGMPLARIEEPLALATFVTGWDVALGLQPSFDYVPSGALTPVEPELPAKLTPR